MFKRSLSLALIGVLTFPPVSGQIQIKPNQFVIRSGPPDLVMRMSASPTSIYGGPWNGVNEISIVTITVENRLTFRKLMPGQARAVGHGSDARGVLVSIDIPAPLSQVGNVTAPIGFQCAVSPNNHTVICWGGTIPAGKSINIEIAVIGEYTCGSTVEMRAVVDPYSWIGEASETNNEATVKIDVYSLC